MPTGTTIQQLVNDLRERKSTIARKFDDCSNDSNCRQKILPLIQSQAWDPSTESLPHGVVTELNLTLAEVTHINAWPVADKTQVRDAIVKAINDDRPMEFFWDLLDDPALNTSQSDIDPPDLGGTGKITVTFLTPRNKVTKSGLTYGSIDLEV